MLQQIVCEPQSLLFSPLLNTNSHIIESSKYFWQNKSLRRLWALLPWTASFGGAYRGVGFKKEKWCEIRSRASSLFVPLISFLGAPVLLQSQSVIGMITLLHYVPESGGKMSLQLPLSPAQPSASRPNGPADSGCCIWDSLWPLATGLITGWTGRDTRSRPESRLKSCLSCSWVPSLRAGEGVVWVRVNVSMVI